MIDTFNDYDYKDTQKVISLKLKQIKEKKLYAWELSNFLGRFNTYYYKAEVINTIAIALNNKIEPENIIIFDQSFKLNQMNGKLSYVSSFDKDLKYLYHIGLPISLFPNKKIYSLNFLFSYFRRYNEFLYTIKNAKRLNKENLSLYFNIYRKNGLNAMYLALNENVRECLEKASLTQSEKKSLNSIHTNFEAKINAYENDEKEIEELKEKLKNNDYKGIDFKSVLFNQYFHNFYYLLNNIQRPIVVVNNDTTGIMTMLCRAQFNKTEIMSSTLDLKSISHNSPFKAIINGGVELYRTFIYGDRKEEIKEREEKEKEINNELQSNVLTQEKKCELINALEVIIKEKETLIKIKDAEELYNLRNIDKLNIKHIQNALKDQDNKNQTKSKSLLKDNNFEVDLSSSDVYDYQSDIDMQI